MAATGFVLREKSIFEPGDWRERVYGVGDRVLFVALIRSTGYMEPESRNPGTVICVFDAGRILKYRIKLNMCWQPNKHFQYEGGENIIVGNVTAGEIRPLSGNVLK